MLVPRVLALATVLLPLLTLILSLALLLPVLLLVWSLLPSSSLVVVVLSPPLLLLLPSWRVPEPNRCCLPWLPPRLLTLLPLLPTVAELSLRLQSLMLLLLAMPKSTATSVSGCGDQATADEAGGEGAARKVGEEHG